MTSEDAAFPPDAIKAFHENHYQHTTKELRISQKLSNSPENERAKWTKIVTDKLSRLLLLKMFCIFCIIILYFFFPYCIASTFSNDIIHCIFLPYISWSPYSHGM